MTTQPESDAIASIRDAIRGLWNTEPEIAERVESGLKELEAEAQEMAMQPATINQLKGEVEEALAVLLQAVKESGHALGCPYRLGPYMPSLCACFKGKARALLHGLRLDPEERERLVAELRQWQEAQHGS